MSESSEPDCPETSTDDETHMYEQPTSVEIHVIENVNCFYQVRLPRKRTVEKLWKQVARVTKIKPPFQLHHNGHPIRQDVDVKNLAHNCKIELTANAAAG